MQPIEQLASAVALSPGRLAHLFRQQLGLPIRRYRMWRAMRAVVGYWRDGASLTEAAHAAGFSDSAHFSNNFRDMFGFNPAQHFSRRSALDLLVDDEDALAPVDPAA